MKKEGTLAQGAVSGLAPTFNAPNSNVDSVLGGSRIGLSGKGRKFPKVQDLGP